MTTWYWGDGTEFEHYYRQVSTIPRKKRKEEEEDYEEIEASLRAALEQLALSDPAYLMRLMAAPEGTPTLNAWGKRVTSEPQSDYDSWKPNYHLED
jgi:hypothetical protein